LTPGGEVKGKRAVNTRLLLAVVVSAILISVLNQTFTNVVVPDIQRDYGVSQGQAGWVITGYLLVFAVGIPLYGRIADLYSLRRVFSLGLLVLAAGSLVCALAPTLPILVAGRIVQAAGAAAIPALGFRLGRQGAPAGERGMALGLLSSSVGVGAAVGPGGRGFRRRFHGLARPLLPHPRVGARPDTASAARPARRGGERRRPDGFSSRPCTTSTCPAASPWRSPPASRSSASPRGRSWASAPPSLGQLRPGLVAAVFFAGA
jgi:hypothetical protein